MNSPHQPAVNQLLFAKYLLSRAKKSQSERGELCIAVSLLLMHDAAEMVMQATTNRLGIAKEFTFMAFWETLKTSGHKEPSFKGRMGTMNALRVNVKHRGILPHAATVRDLLPTVEAFCAEMTNLYFNGLDFADLGLEELIASGDVKNRLQDARKAFAEGKTERAFEGLGIAFDILFRDVSTHAPLIDEPPSIPISERQLPKQQRNKTAKLVKAVQQSVRTLNVLMLGIDPVRYRFFVSNTPRISRTLSGNHQVVFQGNIGQIGTFDTCFDFVVESALTLAEVFRAGVQ